MNLPVGGWRWFDFQMRPVHDAAGELVGIAPEAVEITARRAGRGGSAAGAKDGKHRPPDGRRRARFQ